MRVFNYTKIKKRDKKMHAIFNTTVSKEGLSLELVKVSGFMILIFLIPGLIFCKITGTLWYNPLLIIQGSQSLYFLLIFLGAPIGIALLLLNYRIQNLLLINYLKIYFQPKVPKNVFGKNVKTTGCKYKTFVERL